MTRTESAVMLEFDDPSAAQATAAELARQHLYSTWFRTRNQFPRATSQYRTRPSNTTSGASKVDSNPCGQDSEAEHPHYEKAVRNGKVLLGVSTADQMVDTAAEILARHSPVYVRQEGEREFSSISASWLTGPVGPKNRANRLIRYVEVRGRQ